MICLLSKEVGSALESEMSVDGLALGMVEVVVVRILRFLGVPFMMTLFMALLSLTLPVVVRVVTVGDAL